MTEADVGTWLPAVLSRFDLDREDETPSLIAEAGPAATVVWASASAHRVFGTDDLDALGSLLFRADEPARAFAARLARRGAGPELERLTLRLAGSATPRPISCVAIPLDQGGPYALIRVHAAHMDVLGPSAAPAATAATKQELGFGDNARPMRVLWETDRDGIVTRLLPSSDDVAELGLFPVGEHAASRLQSHAPDLAERLHRALLRREPVGLTRISWPQPASDRFIPIDVGCTARPGLGGLRGFLLVHALPEAASVPSAAIADPTRTSQVDRAIEASHQAPTGAELVSPLGGPAPDLRPARDVSGVTSSTLPVFATPEHISGEPGGNVLHFPAMRLAAVPAKFTAELRPVSTASASSTPADIDPPRWSEQPSPALEDLPEELTADEQDAFAHIARVLGTRTSAQPTPVSEAAPDIAPTSSGALPSDVPTDPLFAAFPIGLLLRRGERVEANPALLQRLGDGTAEAFGARYEGRDPTATGQLTRVDGTDVATDAFDIRWNGGPARLLLASAASPPVRADAEVVPKVWAETLDAVADGFVLLDPSGTIASTSRKAAEMFGSAPKDLIGRGIADLLSESGTVDWSRLRPGRRHGLAIRSRTGGTVPLAVEIVPLGTKLLGVLFVDRQDAVASKDVDMARREAERASVLRSEFLAKVSHEVRTPLNAILGFAEIIRDERLGPVGNTRYLEYLRDIHAAGTRVVSLLDDLLDLSRIEAGRMELRLQAIDANAVVQSCVGTLQTQAHRDRVVVRLSLAPQLPPALADERSFRQIVLNLLSNALKFNEAGGQVIVSTASAGRDTVAIRIRDTGIGMTDDEVAAAMEPFSQLSTMSRPGSGLGLPLTKALVEANCASMAIRSAPGQGTLVEILFPVVEAGTLSLPAE